MQKIKGFDRLTLTMFIRKSSAFFKTLYANLIVIKLWLLLQNLQKEKKLLKKHGQPLITFNLDVQC